ncbi:MAG TPA: hypothetical protein VIZ30_10470, partial [Pseudomonadales bacterium]
MMRLRRLSLATLLLWSAFASAETPAPEGRQESIDDFFTAFTDESMRTNPNFATSTRYFTGAEQDRL